MRLCILLLALGGVVARSDVRGCECVVESSLTANIRGCSLCMEAEKHPVNEKFFLLRDTSPSKPNRWLALPRAPFDGANPLARMGAEDRLALWTLAIAKGKEVWGDGWGVAFNSDISRQQCHLHVHVGKLLDGQEKEGGITVAGPADLPVISDGTGLWFHPVAGKLHVHSAELTTETVLLR